MQASAFRNGAWDVISPKTPRPVIAARLSRAAWSISLIVANSKSSLSEMSNGSLSMDPRQLTATYEDTRLRLTRRQFDLLFTLLRNSGRFVHRTELEATASSDRGGSRRVDMHISRLRKILRATGHTSVDIASVYGIGYALAKWDSANSEEALGLEILEKTPIGDQNDDARDGTARLGQNHLARTL